MKTPTPTETAAALFADGKGILAMDESVRDLQPAF